MQEGKMSYSKTKVKVIDCVKVLEEEWDKTPREERYPYVENIRKSGYVYAVRTEEEING